MNPSTTTQNDKMRAIAKYLSRGWALFPVASLDKVPLIPSVHGRNGPKCRGECGREGHGCWDATTDRRVIDRWWTTWPTANIGIATGASSGFWVLDYDPAADLDQTAYEMTTDLDGPHVRTGGNGYHWRFALPPDFEVTNRRGTLPAGLDVRGTGGYVVAPPSVSFKGEYVEIPTPGDGMAYAAPEWLLDMIRPAAAPTREPPAGWSPETSRPIRGDGALSDDRAQRYATAAVREMLTELCNAHHNRNDLAFRAACRIVEFGNAGWINLAPARDDWETATVQHPAGIVVPLSEAESVWASAQRTIGGRAAVLPPEWTDPLRIMVTAPLPSLEQPPFPVSPNGLATPLGDGVLTIVAPIPPSPTSNGAVPSERDDAWRAAVDREVSRQLVQRAARERIRELEIGDRAARAAALRAELLDATAMRARPRLRPLVAGLLYRNTLARINGPSGHGKSFVTLDLGARVAAGMPWAGREVSRGEVVYLVAEGDEGVGRRMDAWEAYHGRPMVGVRFLPRPVQATGPEWPVLVDVLAEIGPALVVVDTQARVSVGAEENDAKDMGLLVDALDDLRRATGACVLLVHHTGRTGTHGRGSTAVTGALQTELSVSKTGRLIKVATGKAKDDEAADAVEFELRDVMPAAVEVEGLSVVGLEPIGVVPVWSGEVEAGLVVDERPIEPVGRTRARALYATILTYANPGLGLTQADIREHAREDAVWAGLSVNARIKAITKAWNVLIGLGLLARAHGAQRFKVVVLEDQSADGVLTPNRGTDGQPVSLGPEGFDLCLSGDDYTELS